MSVVRLLQPELLHRLDVEEMRRRIVEDQARSRRRRASDRTRIESLEDDVGRLALLVATIYRLLGEKGAITREEFAEASRAVDAMDGTVDGKVTGDLPV